MLTHSYHALLCSASLSPTVLNMRQIGERKRRCAITWSVLPSTEIMWLPISWNRRSSTSWPINMEHGVPWHRGILTVNTAHGQGWLCFSNLRRFTANEQKNMHYLQQHSTSLWCHAGYYDNRHVHKMMQFRHISLTHLVWLYRQTIWLQFLYIWNSHGKMDNCKQVLKKKKQWL